MKLIMALTYDINLKDWDIDCINKIAKTYGIIFKDITLWLKYL